MAQDKSPEIVSGAFEAGEELNYKIKYGFITAADATLRVEAYDRSTAENPMLHFVGSGKTNSSFNFFMKVANRYDSYVSSKTLLPSLYTENIKEGTYKRDGYANFDRKNKKISTKKKTYENIPDKALDVISAFYYARSVDVTKMKQGEKFKMEYFLDDGVYPLEVQYVGKETITTDLGKFECLKFSPTLQPGRIFRKDSKMYLWISNDANRVPMKVEVEILIGSLKLELKSSKGLKNETTSKR